MEWAREWWGVIVGFFLAAIWVGKIQSDVKSLKDAPPCATAEMCKLQVTALKDRLAAGDAQFKEIKEMITSNHRELIGIILKDK